MMSRTTRSTVCGVEARERLLAVGRLHDGVPVLLEREREDLANGVLVVDEQDRGGRLGHRLLGALQADAARIALAMSAHPPPARRRRVRRGSLERPVNGRLYRATFLVLVLPLLILAFSVARPAALSAPLLPPNFDGDATAAARDAVLDAVPRPHAGRPRLDSRRAMVPRPADARMGCPCTPTVDGGRARARPRPAAQRLGGRRRAVARRDRRDGAPRRHAAPARAQTTTRAGPRRSSSSRAATRRPGRRPGSAWAPHTRSSSSPRTAAPSGASARCASPTPALPHRRGGQPGCDRRARAGADCDRGRRAALAGGHARDHRTPARPRADGHGAAPGERPRPAARPRASRSPSTTRGRSSPAASRR